MATRRTSRSLTVGCCVVALAGIGVAGAPGGDLDEACAQAGIDAIAGELQ